MRLRPSGLLVMAGRRAALAFYEELSARIHFSLCLAACGPPPFSGLDLGASGGHPGTLPGLENEPPGRPGEPLWARNECFRVRKIMPPELRTGLPGAECCAYALKLVVPTHLSLCSTTRSRGEARPSPKTRRDTLRWGHADTALTAQDKAASGRSPTKLIE